MASKAIPTKPNGQCYVCKGQKWWYLEATNQWRCATCHPNPNPEDYREPAPLLEVDASRPGQPVIFREVAVEPVPAADPAIEPLRQRIIAGNEKLTAAWLKLKEMPDGPEFAQSWLNFFAAKDKLLLLNHELELRGYEDCLYVENGKKTRRCDSWPNGLCCWACPSDLDYSAQELFGGPLRRIERDPVRQQQGEEVMEFLNTLGGKI